MKLKWKVRKINYLSMLIVFVISVSLGGCTDSEVDNWVEKEMKHPILIGTETCKPPCWQGLVIGKSTFSQALNQMSEYKTQVPDSKLLISDEKEYITLSSLDIEIITRFNDETLQFITFSTEIVDLGSVLAHYGPPEKYYLKEDHMGYFIDLFYPERGIIFRSVNDFSPISETMLVPRFTFYDLEYQPGLFFNGYYGIDLDSLSDKFFLWQGFGACPEGLEFPENCN